MYVGGDVQPFMILMEISVTETQTSFNNITTLHITTLLYNSTFLIIMQLALSFLKGSFNTDSFTAVYIFTLTVIATGMTITLSNGYKNMQKNIVPNKVVEN